jgi:hypothetical protein
MGCYTDRVLLFSQVVGANGVIGEEASKKSTTAAL